MTVVADFEVRVWVPDVWDIVPLKVTPGWTVSRLKAEALAVATGRTVDLADYEVKFRGGRVLDEEKTLGELDTPDQAPFIVLPSRRRPVR